MKVGLSLFLFKEDLYLWNSPPTVNVSSTESVRLTARISSPSAAPDVIALPVPAMAALSAANVVLTSMITIPKKLMLFIWKLLLTPEPESI